MKVNLDIRDDKELRDMVKDMIRGQVKSVMRTDIDEIMKEVVGDKTAKLSDVMAKEITKVVRDFFQSGYTRGPGYAMIEKEIKEQVALTLKKVIQEAR
jgi:hypothetical protein